MNNKKYDFLKQNWFPLYESLTEAEYFFTKNKCSACLNALRSSTEFIVSAIIFLEHLQDCGNLNSNISRLKKNKKLPHHLYTNLNSLRSIGNLGSHNNSNRDFTAPILFNDLNYTKKNLNYMYELALWFNNNYSSSTKEISNTYTVNNNQYVTPGIINLSSSNYVDKPTVKATPITVTKSTDGLSDNLDTTYATKKTNKFLKLTYTVLAIALLFIGINYLVKSNVATGVVNKYEQELLSSRETIYKDLLEKSKLTIIEQLVPNDKTMKFIYNEIKSPIDNSKWPRKVVGTTLSTTHPSLDSTPANFVYNFNIYNDTFKAELDKIHYDYIDKILSDNSFYSRDKLKKRFENKFIEVYKNKDISVQLSMSVYYKYADGFYVNYKKPHKNSPTGYQNQQYLEFNTKEPTEYVSVEVSSIVPGITDLLNNKKYTVKSRKLSEYIVKHR